VLYFCQARIFKTRYFARWARKVALHDASLLEAVREMAAGLVDADLGGGVVKKRVALPGRGKRGGSRTLVATNRADRWVFLLGFGKNERDDIDPAELEALKSIADMYLAYGIEDLEALAMTGALEEVRNEVD